MKKLGLLAILLLVLGAVGWLPVKPRDVGDLLPVEALVLSERDGLLYLDGGNNLVGRGATWAEAVEDLTETAPGVAFFDTTAHIILCGDTVDCLEQVLDDRALRPAARIYLGQGTIAADDAVKYLATHRGRTTLQGLQAAWLEERPVPLPVLTEEDGRYRLTDDE